MAIRGTLKGFGVTFSHMFKKVVTEEYPEQRKPPAPRYHGRLSEMGVVDGRVVNDRDSTAFRGDDVLAFLPLALKPAMVPVAQSL